MSVKKAGSVEEAMKEVLPCIEDEAGRQRDYTQKDGEKKPI